MGLVEHNLNIIIKIRLNNDPSPNIIGFDIYLDPKDKQSKKNSGEDTELAKHSGGNSNSHTLCMTVYVCWNHVCKCPVPFGAITTCGSIERKG